MPKKIVMLVGRMGSGKSTVAQMMTDYGFDEKTFAGPLKKVARTFGFTHKQIYGTQEQKLEINDFWNISGREFLQKFGTDLCRNELPKKIPGMDLDGRQIWARLIEKQIKHNSRLVLSDGRFLDEARLVKDYKGVIIRITRPDTNACNVHNTHKSETELDQIQEDFCIENNGSLTELNNKLFRILNSEGLLDEHDDLTEDEEDEEDEEDDDLMEEEEEEDLMEEEEDLMKDDDLMEEEEEEETSMPTTSTIVFASTSLASMIVGFTVCMHAALHTWL